MHPNQLTDVSHPLYQLISISAILGAFAGFIPSFAATVAVLWYLILIWESKTFETWRHRRKLRKLDKLKAQEAYLLRRISEAETTEDKSDSPISDQIAADQQP